MSKSKLSQSVGKAILTVVSKCLVVPIPSLHDQSVGTLGEGGKKRERLANIHVGFQNQSLRSRQT